ncbi:MAG TPA: nucleotidyltransferase family protein [Erysipelothrix sp.]
MHKNKRKALGLIVEYNPMHNGHRYHLHTAIKKSQAEVVIAAMSPQFVQRGEPALINKYERTQIALDSGIDIVIEIPTFHVLQRADVFAKSAITLLDHLGVDEIIYGSESNQTQSLVFDKEIMTQGGSFAKASNQNTLGPNDILGAIYQKIAQEKNIACHSIQRQGNYHDLATNKEIISASAIRHALKTKQAYEHGLFYKLDVYDHHFLEDYLPYIRYQIIQQNEAQLAKHLLMDEGIEHLFKKQRYQQDLINSCTSKRYTRTRIQRTLLNLYLGIEKKDYPIPTSPRILGLSQKGILYLNEIKDSHQFSSKFTDYLYHQEELKFTQLYAQILPLDKQKILEQQEVSFPIIKQAKDRL